MKQQRGFTLLELMITVSVAAVLVAVGVPGFQEFVRNNRRATEINNLIATLQIARSEAVVRNGSVGICPTTNNTSCTGSSSWETGWLVFADTDGDGVLDGGETVLRTTGGPKGITVRAEISALDYLPNGRITTVPASTEANFTFCDDRGAAAARVVQLELAGRPKS